MIYSNHTIHYYKGRKGTSLVQWQRKHLCEIYKIHQLFLINIQAVSYDPNRPRLTRQDIYGQLFYTSLEILFI